ncbi:MAG: NAD-dependent epimerase/dehydratase family protein [Bacillota bacterium]
MERVLVTGGCGYIGSVLVPMLLEKGYGVRVFDKLYFGSEGLKECLDKIELVTGDIRKIEPGVLEGVDHVIHLGSLSNDPTAAFNPEANYTINYMGSVDLAKISKKMGVKKFTYASSAATYGFYIDGVATEDNPVNPQSEYAKSKIDVDYELQELAGDSFCPVALRQSTVHGYSPRMRWDLVVNAFVMYAFKTGCLDVWYGGEAFRPNIHVADVAAAHIACIEADPELVCGEIFNIAGENYKVLEMAHRIRNAIREVGLNVQVEVNYEEADNRSYRVSGEKIKKRIGFTPRWTIEESARDIAEKILDGTLKKDFDNPIYYNIGWMLLLKEMEERLKVIGKIF